MKLQTYESLKRVNALLKRIGLDWLHHVGATEYEDGVFFVRRNKLFFHGKETIFAISDIVDVRYCLIDREDEEYDMRDQPDYVKIDFANGDSFFFCSDDYDSWMEMRIAKPIHGSAINCIEESSVARYLSTGQVQYTFEYEVSDEMYDLIKNQTQREILCNDKVFIHDKLIFKGKSNQTPIETIVVEHGVFLSKEEISKMTSSSRRWKFGSENEDKAFENLLKECGFANENEANKYVEKYFTKSEQRNGIKTLRFSIVEM